MAKKMDMKKLKTSMWSLLTESPEKTAKVCHLLSLVLCSLCQCILNPTVYWLGCIHKYKHVFTGSLCKPIDTPVRPLIWHIWCFLFDTVKLPFSYWFGIADVLWLVDFLTCLFVYRRCRMRQQKCLVKNHLAILSGILYKGSFMLCINVHLLFSCM